MRTSGGEGKPPIVFSETPLIFLACDSIFKGKEKCPETTAIFPDPDSQALPKGHRTMPQGYYEVGSGESYDNQTVNNLTVLILESFL